MSYGICPQHSSLLFLVIFKYVNSYKAIDNILPPVEFFLNYVLSDYKHIFDKIIGTIRVKFFSGQKNNNNWTIHLEYDDLSEIFKGC